MGNQTVSKVVEEDFERLPQTECAGQDPIPSAFEEPKPETKPKTAEAPVEKSKAAPDREKAASNNSNKEKEKQKTKRPNPISSLRIRSRPQQPLKLPDRLNPTVPRLP
ncbi:hypothetical protein [Allobaculum sp. Allo2]|uniref:hypothetical protein n=1 Tax=Allobaculum sp. Allo2 TaxID=2853432 RepID=UPI001F611DDD|nr:hypothetical protein [Allobaculum sp. Allo2]UNT94174.1 hypothetical protein KWG61_05965 [Allobaculum sp. Allo2]